MENKPTRNDQKTQENDNDSLDLTEKENFININIKLETICV